MGSEERDNPLFGHTISPSPSKPGTIKNPVWSPSDKPAWEDPSTVPRLSPCQYNNGEHQPASTAAVKGMRRLSSLDPWEVDAARRRQQLSEEEEDDDIDMQDNNEGGGEGYQQYQQQQLLHYNNRGFPPSMSLITNNNTSSSIAAALGHPPEELEFAQVLELVMRGELDTSGALQQYAKICMDKAGELRDQARAEVQRAARQAALVSSAQELEAESATWQLLWHLYGVESREFPGGKGGNFADGAGLEKTYRQRAADVVFEDDEVNRCARIVAWLEALSSEALVIQGGGGGGGQHQHQQAEAAVGASSFTSTDGLWRETKSRIAGGLMGRDAATLVSRVDPDAMTRQIGKRLLPENTKDEERLAVEIWRLVRAGKMSAAAKLCEAVGQPWRAASLTGGGGPQGVLPVGTAALEADESEDMADVQAADLAVDVEGGEGVSRALWRWTCALAADRIAAAGSGGPNNNTNNNKGAVYESALYGVLSSHLARVLPVCKSWEDMLWATLRCWLDAAVDIQLGVGLGSDSSDACGLAELRFLATNQQQQQTNEGGGGGGNWPPEQLRDALPSSFQDAVSNLADGSGSGTSAFLSSSSAAAAAGAVPASYLSGNLGNAAQYRAVQNALMLESIQELVCEILSIWVIKKSGAGLDTNPTSSEQQQQQLRALGGRNQSFPSLQGGGGGGGGGGVMNMDTTNINIINDEDSPSSPPGVMRFAAHMALGLWGLGIMSPSSRHQTDTYGINIINDDDDDHQGGEYSSVVQDTLHRLVQVYVARLIDSGAHNLVPLYACHLRAGLRWMTYHAFFDQLIAAGAAAGEGAGGNMVACKAAYDLGDSWFRYWKQSGGNNSNINSSSRSSDEEGDMAEDEMAVIALGSVKRSRFEVYGGPMLRAQFIRWLCFGGVEEKAAAVHGANVLCREFALAGSGGLAAADALLAEIMPTALGQPLGEFLDELPELRQQQRREGVVMEEEEEEERPSTSALFLEKQGLVGQIAELKCWIAYFHIQSEFASWCQLYAEAKEASSSSEEAGTVLTDHLRALGEETLPLLDEATAFVSDRQLQWLVEDTLPTDYTKGSHVPSTSSSPFEIAVVVGPEMGLEAPLSHQFPTFTDDQEVEAVSEGVLAAMRDAAASVSTTTTVGGGGGGGSGSVAHSSSLISGLEVAAGPAPEDMPSMLSIAIDYSAAKKQQQQHQDGMTVAVALLGLVLKGATRLVGDDGMPLLGPLSIVNMDAHPLAAAELCRTVCYPRMALMAAAMREAVAYMGVGGVESGAGEAGSGLVEAAAAADLTKYFSTMELKELLQYERATEVLQMRNVEKEKGLKERERKE